MKIKVTLEFESSEYFPADDEECLKENLHILLSDALVSSNLLRQSKASNCSSTLMECLKEDERVAREMIKSMKVKVG